MPGIGIIHNPFARGNLRRPAIIEDLKKILGDSGEVIQTRSIEELPDALKDFVKKGFDILGVNGGDGSMHLVLSAFINAMPDQPLPKIVALRGGTMNTMPNSVGLKGSTIYIAQKLVKKYRSGAQFEYLKQHLVRLNDKYGFMTGAGVPPNFLAAYYSGTSTGPWQGVKVIVRAILSFFVQGPYIKFIFEPAKCIVKVNNEELPAREFVAFLGCSIKEIGLGFTFCPHVYDQPGKFQFIATNAGPFFIIRNLHNFWLGRDVASPEVFNYITDKVLITPLANMRYMIDGEIYETEEPIEMATGPTIDLIKI